MPAPPSNNTSDEPSLAPPQAEREPEREPETAPANRATATDTTRPNDADLPAQDGHVEHAVHVTRAEAAQGQSITALLGLIALLPRFNRERLPSSQAFLALLGTMIVAGWVLLDAYLHRPVVAFQPAAFVDLAWFALATLAIAALASMLARGRLPYVRALLLVLLCVPAWVLLYSVVPPWAALDVAHAQAAKPAALSSRQLSVLAVCAWAALVLLRGLYSHLALRAWPVWVTLLLMGALVSEASNALGAYPAFWANADDQAALDTQNADPDDGAAAAEDDKVWQRANALLFSQPERIDQALAQLPPAASGGSKVFFLGFAGYGDQKVFANEIGTAQSALEARFDIGPRAMQLVNDRRDPDGKPLASVSALRRTLHGLAERMNLDKDVLVLALSSHGSPDASIAVTNGDLPFEDLRADELAAALKASGIKWRVIVISACYGGSFIPELKDANTIVLAAAAADRASFGCADDRELTYFGEAFYRDALPRAVSVRDAFNTAAAAIHKREQQEELTPSLPAAWYGTAIEAHIAPLLLPGR